MAGSVKDLSKYRFERCSEELENSKILLDAGKFKLSLNRSYYSIFHGMRAVNVLDDFDSSKHSGVIAHFNQFHVKEGHFPKDIKNYQDSFRNAGTCGLRRFFRSFQAGC